MSDYANLEQYRDVRFCWDKLREKDAEIARLTEQGEIGRNMLQDQFDRAIQQRDDAEAEIARLTMPQETEVAAHNPPERREKSIGQMQVEELLANRPKVGPDWTDEQVKAALKSWFPNSYVEDRDFDLFGEDMRAAFQAAAALKPDTGAGR